jgi:Glu-tRNA(Gln) amidotransferase subunit E-like FAD-binding protein
MNIRNVKNVWRLLYMDKYIELQSKVNLLEYHQRLLLKMLSAPNLEFYRLVIENGISELEVQEFNKLCEDLNKKMEEQKAEGFVNFHPLFNEFLYSLPAKFDAKEVVQSCVNQRLYEPLFREFQKCL